MQDLSVYVFQQILEGQGWRGLVQASAHVRDLTVYLDVRLGAYTFRRRG